MAANKIEGLDQASGARRKRLSVPPAAYIIAAVLVVGAGGLLYLDRLAHREPPAPPPLTGDARAYIHNGFLKISDAGMQAHENYLHQNVVEITGKIANSGDRVLDTVSIVCVFYDPYGHVVLRQRVAIVDRKMGRLAPGESKPFRLAFDTVPDTWNQTMPQMVIAAIDFA